MYLLYSKEFRYTTTTFFYLPIFSHICYSHKIFKFNVWFFKEPKNLTTFDLITFDLCISMKNEMSEYQLILQYKKVVWTLGSWIQKTYFCDSKILNHCKIDIAESGYHVTLTYTTPQPPPQPQKREKRNVNCWSLRKIYIISIIFFKEIKRKLVNPFSCLPKKFSKQSIPCYLLTINVILSLPGNFDEISFSRAMPLSLLNMYTSQLHSTWTFKVMIDKFDLILKCYIRVPYILA